MAATPSSSPGRSSSHSSPLIRLSSSRNGFGASTSSTRMTTTRSLDQQTITLRAAESVQTIPMDTLSKKKDGSFAIFAHRSNDSDNDEDAKYEEQQREKMQQRARKQTMQQQQQQQVVGTSEEHHRPAPFGSLRSASPTSFRRLQASPQATAKDSELVQHIRELRRALSEDLEMEHGVREHLKGKQQRGVSSGGHPLDREAREHGVDFDLLRDLRAAFSVYNSSSSNSGTTTTVAPSSSAAATTSDVVDGIPEAEFIRIFGGAIGGFTSDEVLRAWCRQMDSRCAGVLSWRDLSTYLVKSSTNNTWLTRHAHHHRQKTAVNNDSLAGNHNNNTSGGSFLAGSGSSFNGSNNNKSFSGAFAVSNEETLMEWQRDLCGDRQLEGRSVQSKGHNTVITHLLALPSVNTFISASNDGSLRRWDHWSLEGDAKPMHVCNEWITGLVKVTGMNRIGVLHSDRSIFFYDLHMPSKSSSGRQQGPPVVVDYYRGFAQTTNVFIQTLTQPAVGQKAIGSSMIRKRAPGEVPNRPPLPVTLIAPKIAPSTAFCHIQSTPVVETVMLGNGDGSLEMLGLRIGETYESVIQPMFELPAVHRGRVAQVTYAPELDSAISAGSTDGVIIVTNLEHLVTTQSMHSDIDHRSAKAIQQFDYRPEYHHMLVHGYGRNIFIWNALTGMRNHSITDIDHVVLQCSLNADRHRLYALTDDKTIKVYDVRTWKYLDSVSDEKLLRVPVNQFEAMIFSEATSMVVTGGSNLVAWRTDEAQKLLEDNSTAPVAGGGAGLMSPSHRMMLKSGASAGRRSKKKLASKQEPIHTLLCLLSQCQVVTVDTDNVVQVWSTLSTRRLIKWKWPYPSSIMCAAVSHKGRQLIVGSDDGSVRSVSIGTGALCWSLDHPCGHGAGFEVSACYLAHHAPIPNHSLLFAAISRHIVAWLYDEETAINPSSSIALKTVASWRTLQLPVDFGIVHSFCATGPDGLCYLAATNSGHVVGFNVHVQMLYVVPPPSQIAAELLHRLSAKVTAVSYSDGMMLLLRADVGGFNKHMFHPFRATWKEGHAVTSITTARIVSQEPPLDYHNLHNHNAQRQRAAVADRGDAHLIAVGDSSGHITLFVVGDVPPATAIHMSSSRSARAGSQQSTTTKGGGSSASAVRRQKKPSTASDAGLGPQVVSFASTVETTTTSSSSIPQTGEYRVRAVWAWHAHDDAAVSGLHFFDPDASPHHSAIEQQRKKERRGEEERVELAILPPHIDPLSAGGGGGGGGRGPSSSFFSQQPTTKVPTLSTLSLVSSCTDGALVEWSVSWHYDARTTQQQQQQACGGSSANKPKMGALQDPSTAATTNRTRSRPGIVFESDMGVANFDSSSSSSSSAAGSSDDDDDADDLMTDKNQLLAQTSEQVASSSQVVESPTSTPQRKQSLRRISSNAAAAGVFQLPPLVDILIVADVKRNSVFGQAASKGAATAPSALIPSPSMMSQKLALPPIAMSPARNNAASPFGNGSIVNFVVNVDIGGGGGVDDLISPVGGGLDTSGNTPPFSLISPLAKKTSSVVQSSMYRRSPPQRSFTSGGGTPPRQVSPTTSPVDDIVRNVVQQHAFIRLGEHQQQQPQKGGGGGGGFVSFAGVELTSFASTSLDDNAAFSSSVHGGNKSQAGLQRRLSKRFLTFSNLLDAADRAALFEGTPQDPTDSTSLEQSLSPRGGLGATIGGSHSTIGGVGIGGTALMPGTSSNNDVASSFRKSSGSFLSAGSLLSPQQQQQQRRGSSSLHQLPQQPSFRGTGATSPIREGGGGGEEDNNKTSHVTSPSSGVKKRFVTRYGTSTATSPVSPLSKGSEAHTLMVSELQRPLSRVSALRRIHGKEDDDEDISSALHDGGAPPSAMAMSSSSSGVLTSPKSTTTTAGAPPSNRPSQSVERRLASVHRRREDREEAEFVHGFQPYFGRVALQLFDGEREQLEKNKEH